MCCNSCDLGILHLHLHITLTQAVISCVRRTMRRTAACGTAKHCAVVRNDTRDVAAPEMSVSMRTSDPRDSCAQAC